MPIVEVPHKTTLRLGFIVSLAIIAFSISGCGNSSLFKGLSGGGVPLTGSAGATAALNNGDYATALSRAAEAIASPDTPTADLQEAYLAKGQALLGQAGVTAVDIATSIGDRSGNENTIDLIPAITLTVATASAEAINTAFSLTNTAPPDNNFGNPTPVNGVVIATGLSGFSLSPNDILKINTASTITKDQYIARLVANLVVMATMLNTVYDIGSYGSISMKYGYTIRGSLDYLYATDSLMDYAAVVAVTYQNCGLSADSKATIVKAIIAVVNVSYINAARKSGNPYSYRGSDGRTINSSSTDEQIRSAVEFEIKKVH